MSTPIFPSRLIPLLQAPAGQQPGMTALFATNYDTTVGAMMAINEYGISVPEDLSVFGFDDMPFAKVIKPHLSVIAQPIGNWPKHRLYDFGAHDRP